MNCSRGGFQDCGHRDRRWHYWQPGEQLTEEVAPELDLKEWASIFRYQASPSLPIFLPIHLSNSWNLCQRSPNLALQQIHQEVPKKTASRAHSQTELLQPERQGENVFNSPGNSVEQLGLEITNHIQFHSLLFLRTYIGPRTLHGTVGTRWTNSVSLASEKLLSGRKAKSYIITWVSYRTKIRLFGTSFSLEPNLFFVHQPCLDNWYVNIRKSPVSFLFYLLEYTSQFWWAVGTQLILKIQIIQLFVLHPFLTNSSINKLSADFCLYNFSAGVVWCR